MSRDVPNSYCLALCRKLSCCDICLYSKIDKKKIKRLGLMQVTHVR